MREFKHSNGGLPIYTDDLIWVNDNFRLFMDAVANAVGDVFELTDINFRVNGAEHEVDSGWIVLGGQICRVVASTTEKFATGLSDAAEMAAGSGTYFEIQDVNDAAGERGLVAGGTFSPWNVRTAVLSSSNTGGAYTQGVDGWHHSSLVTLNEALATLVIDEVKAKIKATTSNLAVSSVINGWALGVNNHLYIQKDLHGWVRMSGTLDGTSASSSHFYTLPAEYRPFINGVVGSGAFSNASGDGEVWIDPGGIMRGTTGGSLSFCLTYYTGT